MWGGGAGQQAPFLQTEQHCVHGLPGDERAPGEFGGGQSWALAEQFEACVLGHGQSVTGPDFIALQVRDLDASATFYETRLGLRRAPTSPPGAVVFATAPVPFAVRTPLPGVDLDAATPWPGTGVALWLHADDAQALHDDLAAGGVPIVAAPVDGPFGRTFTFRDPDGYAITVHDRA